MSKVNLTNLIEYIKLHIISLEQDIEKINYTNSDIETFDWHYIQGQIGALKHILEVANDNV
jgi:hypothetical protein